MKLIRLFQSGVIGNVPVKNRIVMAPMGTHFADKDGSISDQLVNYYKTRALGGTGTIIIEASFPVYGINNRICIADDRFIPGLNRLSSAIHKAGAKTFIQIQPGRGRKDTIEPVSCSRLLIPGTEIMARSLRTEEIEHIISEFGKAALRARKSGFDGIEIHGANGYLVSDFLSSNLNNRTDKYGGSIENRVRFASDLIKTVKAEAGKDFAVIFRLSVDEVNNNLSLTEAASVSRLLEESGADAIDITSGGIEDFTRIVGCYYLPSGYNTDYSEYIKKSVHIPVSVVGRINDPELAEAILIEGKADFITMGRALLADPDLPNKAAEGKTINIRKCIACCKCIDVMVSQSLQCTLNSDLGNESEQISIVNKPKKVLVVGGGPGGVEAARIAASRGHIVTLWEKGNMLGGLLKLAAIPPCKQNLFYFIGYLTKQLENLNVKVEFNREANEADILNYGADVIIIATGSSQVLPSSLRGITSGKVVTVDTVLENKVSVGPKIVVLGGGLVGCEVADFLAAKGNKIEIVEILETIASDVSIYIRPYLLERLQRNGVSIFTNTTLEDITETGVKVKNKNGKYSLLDADNIVVAIGNAPNNELFKLLSGKHPSIYAIGDCIKPRNIIDAIQEGAAIARQI